MPIWEQQRPSETSKDEERGHADVEESLKGDETALNDFEWADDDGGWMDVEEKGFQGDGPEREDAHDDESEEEHRGTDEEDFDDPGQWRVVKKRCIQDTKLVVEPMQKLMLDVAEREWTTVLDRTKCDIGDKGFSADVSAVSILDLFLSHFVGYLRSHVNTVASRDSRPLKSSSEIIMFLQTELISAFVGTSPTKVFDTAELRQLARGLRATHFDILSSLQGPK